MQKKTYEDYKYSLQDTGRLYVGCRYTFAELADEEDILFKFRLVMEKYVMEKVDREDTLETHLYYLTPDSFLVKLYGQMKAQVKVNVIEEKKSFFGGGSRRRYVTKRMTVGELTAIPPDRKEKQGLVIQELSVSKLALMGL